MECLVRALSFSDKTLIEQMDELSGNDVSQWFNNEDDYAEEYAYGIFRGDEMIGYCTIGNADDCGEMIESHALYSHDALMLSDVYVKPSCRGLGVGTQLVATVVVNKLYTNGIDTVIYLTVLYDLLGEFYRKIGFEWCTDAEEYAMFYSFFRRSVNEYSHEMTKEMEIE